MRRRAGHRASPGALPAGQQVEGRSGTTHGKDGLHVCLPGGRLGGRPGSLAINAYAVPAEAGERKWLGDGKWGFSASEGAGRPRAGGHGVAAEGVSGEQRCHMRATLRIVVRCSRPSSAGRLSIADGQGKRPTRPNVEQDILREANRPVTAGGGGRHRGDRRDTSKMYAGNRRHAARGNTPRADVKTRKR